MNNESKENEINKFLGNSKVFFVGSKTDDTVLVAIDPTYEEGTNIVR